MDDQALVEWAVKSRFMYADARKLVQAAGELFNLPEVALYKLQQVAQMLYKENEKETISYGVTWNSTNPILMHTTTTSRIRL